MKLIIHLIKALEIKPGYEAAWKAKEELKRDGNIGIIKFFCINFSTVDFIIL